MRPTQNKTGTKPFSGVPLFTAIAITAGFLAGCDASPSNSTSSAPAMTAVFNQTLTDDVRARWKIPPDIAEMRCSVTSAPIQLVHWDSASCRISLRGQAAKDMGETTTTWSAPIRPYSAWDTGATTIIEPTFDARLLWSADFHLIIKNSATNVASVEVSVDPSRVPFEQVQAFTRAVLPFVSRDVAVSLVKARAATPDAISSTWTGK